MGLIRDIPVAHRFVAAMLSQFIPDKLGDHIVGNNLEHRSEATMDQRERPWDAPSTSPCGHLNRLGLCQ
jgi:hypothetical protein